MSYREGTITQVDVCCGDCVDKADHKPMVLAVGTVQHGRLVDISTLHRSDRPHRHERSTELYDLVAGGESMPRSTGFHPLEPEGTHYVLTCKGNHRAPKNRSKPSQALRIEVNADRLRDRILEVAALSDAAIKSTFVAVHSDKRPSISRTRRHNVW